jgi:hypothetical protein
MSEKTFNVGLTTKLNKLDLVKKATGGLVSRAKDGSLQRIDIETSVRKGSNKPITSAAVYDAIQKITGTSTIVAGSGASVAVPSLQQVTIVGNKTTKGIILEDATQTYQYELTVDSSGNLIFTGGTSKNAHFSGDVVAFSSATPPASSWWDDMPIATDAILGGVKVDGTTITVTAGGVISAAGDFVGLDDTPSSYLGQGSKAVAVNSGATALEFVDFPVNTPWTISGSDIYFSTGNVSIGSSTTSQRLTVNEPNSSDLFTALTARGGNGLESSILFSTKTSGGTNTGGSVGHDGATDSTYLAHGTGGYSSADIIINSDGEVGVGGTPTQAFQLHGNEGDRARFTFGGENIDIVDFAISANPFSDTRGISCGAGKKLVFLSDKQDQVWITRADSGTYYERMNLDHETGGLGIGTNAHTYPFHVHSSDGNSRIVITDAVTTDASSSGLTIGLNSSQAPFIWNYENTDMSFATNSVVRMVVKSAGVDITGDLDVSSQIFVGTSPGSTYTIEVDGTVNATDFRATSDRRLKNSVFDLDTKDALCKIAYLKPSRFFWNNNDGRERKGFIAQDVEKVIPEAVTTCNEGYKGIDYNAIVSELVAANQELLKRVESLERRLK